MFAPNTNHYMAFDNSFLNLTEREQKALDDSWAKTFGDEIFPAIDEKPFSVLYSDTAFRPNTLVNVIIGAMLIKELFHLSDDQIVEGLMLDVRMKHAQRADSLALEAC